MHLQRDTPPNPPGLSLGRHGLMLGKRLLAPVWMRLGRLETRCLRDRLPAIDRPLYITGMARAGSTITLDMLSRHRDLAAHRYLDMAQPYLPFVWNRLAARLPLRRAEPVPRIHDDRILVTRDSPEAVEESLWQHFFPWLHDESRPAVLGEDTRHAAFESFYRATLAKLLLARGKPRYLSKANYNLTRIAYLLRVVPGARFIVLFREPQAHFASWMKQHRLFTDLQRRDRRWLGVLDAVGHHEFGLDQRFVHTGRADHPRLRALWNEGRFAEAFGRHWSALYGHVLDLVNTSPAAREAVLFVRYEDLCAHPAEVIGRMLDHAQLDRASFAPVQSHFEGRLSLPRYYGARLDDTEASELDQSTRSTRGRLGRHCELARGVSP